MTFGNARVLWILLVAIPALTGFLYWAWRRRQRDILLFVRSRLLAELTVGLSSVRRQIRLVLIVLSVAAILLALAKPRWGVTFEEVKQNGLDIVVGIDVSRSMNAEDVPPNRLARAKLAAMELMPLAKRDRLGLVAFAGSAFLQCPLTLDEEAFRQSVDTLEVGLIPQGGTALGEAIQVAEESFKKEEGNVKVLVLITDGEDHEAGALEAAEKAAAEGVRIFTIGVGTAEGDMLHQNDASEPFFKDSEGNVVKSRLDENHLRELAAKGHGFYLPMRGAKVMDTLYERGLSPLFGHGGAKLGDRAEKSAPRMLKHYSERFEWFLGFAILALLLEQFLPERRIVFKPDKSIRDSGSALGKLASALVWLALAQTAAASSSGALRSYEDGHYQSSFLEYKRLLDKNPQDPRLSFNAGSAAYQAKQYDEAVSLFSEALKSQDIKLQEQAFYNLGNTQFRAGQGMTEPQQQQQAWEAAVQNFENARKLNPKDEDAKFNLEVVKKKLEELKKQREQSQKDKPNQDQKDDKKDQKDDKKDQDKQDPKDQNKDQKQDSSKDQQNKQPDQQPDKPGQKDQQNKPQDKKDPGTNQPPHPEPKKDEDKKQAKAPKPEKGDQQKKGDDEPKPAEGTKGDQKPPNAQSGNTAPLPVGVMSKEQAERLLDALKREEKAMIFKPQAPSKSQPRSFKDW